MHDEDTQCAVEPHAKTDLERISEPLLQRSANIFRAMGEPGRLAVLLCLHHQELCVSELAQSLDEQISTVSQRLKVLHREGLIARRREGKHIYYTCADDHVTELLDNALHHAIELAQRSVLRPATVRQVEETRT